jgi:hypothetical protein
MRWKVKIKIENSEILTENILKLKMNYFRKLQKIDMFGSPVQFNLHGK